MNARRILLLVGLAAIAVLAAKLVTDGDDGYLVRAEFRDTGGLRDGFKVRIDGAPVGEVAKLTLNDRDHVVAELRVDESAAPVGRDARVTVRAADLLGEKFVDLDPGDRKTPIASGEVIGTARTGVAVELDDVINAVDLPTRDALRTFINEQGTAVVGRGRDLAKLLTELPGALDRSGQVIDEFARDNEALGRLVEESDRVVGAIAAERDAFGRFVGSASGTLDTLGRRSRELGATVREAPSTLVAARGALTSLEGAARPLGPAARGLRATAPQLDATLKALPEFSEQARPTLRTVREVAPRLQTLGRQATPVVRRLRPLAQQLDGFSDHFAPVTETLDSGIGDLLGVLEGWARATQARDRASHVFRFGLTMSGAMSPEELASALSGPLGKSKKKRAPKAEDKPAKQVAPSPSKPPIQLPEVRLPKVPNVPLVGDAPQRTADAVNDLLDYLLKP